MVLGWALICLGHGIDPEHWAWPASRPGFEGLERQLELSGWRHAEEAI